MSNQSYAFSLGPICHFKHVTIENTG
ncbi:MAG: hypothetical protein RJB47_75, partial [Pseudomonadota bacterium]